MFRVLSVALCFLGFIHGESSFDETCKLINGLECETFHDHVTCGTNGISYLNRCYFSKAHCQDPNVHFLHSGSCGNGASTTLRHPSLPTMGPTTAVPVSTTHKTGEVIQEIFCAAIEDVECGIDGIGVCASNGVYFPSQCHFEKARCLDKSLSAAHDGNCP